jgi:hypothetical protein
MCNALAMTPSLKLSLLYNLQKGSDVVYGLRQAYGSRLTAYGLRFTAYGVRLTAYGLRPTAYSLRLAAYGLQLTAYGLIQTIAFGLLLYLTSNELHLMTLTL